MTNRREGRSPALGQFLIYCKDGLSAVVDTKFSIKQQLLEVSDSLPQLLNSPTLAILAACEGYLRRVLMSQSAPRAVYQIPGIFSSAHTH